MRNETYYPSSARFNSRLAAIGLDASRKTAIGFILLLALLAFEVFNFDTTRYALRNLLGDVEFLSLQWAAILAIAFCSIDFAGLVRLFTPERGRDEPKEVWYLMGAWLLGATMNAVMTWWAVSLTLLNHDFGNEILSREQLLNTVPIFVAVLVWITRILFIGAFSIAGEHIFDFTSDFESSQTPLPPPPQAASHQKRVTPRQPRSQQPSVPAPSSRAVSPVRNQNRAQKSRAQRVAAPARPKVVSPQPKPQPRMASQVVEPYPIDDVPEFFDEYEPMPTQRPLPNQRPVPPQPAKKQQPTSRIKQRPPRPSGPNVRRKPSRKVH